jgi:dTDP-4-amino-4,6-dideoxygalactose transaminase
MAKSEFRIPFNRPFIVGKELYNIAQAVIEYYRLSGDGEYTKRCQKWLEERLGCAKALLTHSCTGALEMAAIMADIGLGDEVIMPSFTFVSTANAFVLRGGVPVFVDIKPETLNIDENKIEEAITDRTKAIIPVHYAGVPCAMDEILDIARRFGLLVVEDAAQALLSTYKGRCLGTIGNLGALSFHETKNIISGEGGALLINEDRFVERAEIVWEKGTNRKKFFRGEVDRYNWVDIGSSFLPSDMIAAFLIAQLEFSGKIIAARSRIFHKYYEGLAGLEEKGCLNRPYVENEGTCNGHIFYIITRTPDERSRLITYLKEDGINAIFHYQPLHASPAGRRFARASGDLKVTEDLSERLLRLPVYYEMTEEEVSQVVNALKSFYGQKG